MKQKMISRIGALILAGSMAFTAVDLPELAKAAESGTAEKVKTTDEIIGNDEAGIPDENFYQGALEQCDGRNQDGICEENNKDGLLQKTEAAACEYLSLSYSQIENIKGIEYFVNLSDLNLGNNNITNIESLSDMDNLRVLYLNDNHITDIEPLSKLVNLYELSLGGNSISDITVLSNLPNLKYLILSRNPISDVGSLSNLNNLELLRISEAELSDLSALENLTKLNELWLNNNKIKDIDALSGLINLTDLDLAGNEICNLGGLSELVNLSLLDLESNNISDISSLEKLVNLKDLGLENNHITSTKGLSEAKKMEGLDLASNSLEDISDLSEMVNLKILYLDNNKISDVSSLAKLKNLKWLNLENNNINDISCLKNSDFANGIKERCINNQYESEMNAWSIAYENDLDREDEILALPKELLNYQTKKDVDYMWSDREFMIFPAFVAVPTDSFSTLLEKNKKRDIVMKSDSDILLTFAKESMKDVSGNGSYDFSNTIERDYSKIAKIPDKITKDNFVLQITYGENGAFPAEAEVYLFAGKEYAGERLSYGRLENGRLVDVNSAVVNEKGYIKVKQDQGGTYILSVSEGGAELIDELGNAKDGETVEAEFSEEDAVLSQNVLETMQDKDVNLKVTLDNGIAWNVNGKSLPETGLSDMNLAVKKAAVGEGKIDEKEISDLAGTRSAGQLVFHENGELGFAAQLTITADAQAKGDKAVLLQKTASSAGTSGTGTGESAGEQLQLADACMIKDQSVTFEISRKADSAVIYGTNGDTDGDGAVKLTDMMQVLHHVSSRTSLNEVQKGFADVDMNNKVEIQDLMRELHFVSKRSQSVYDGK